MLMTRGAFDAIEASRAAGTFTFIDCTRATHWRFHYGSYDGFSRQRLEDIIGRILKLIYG